MNIISCFINLTTNHTNNLTNFSRNIIACLKTQHNGKIDAGAKKQQVGQIDQRYFVSNAVK